MAKSSFEVGEKEKHTLTVDHDWVMKRILIELDGEKLAYGYHYSPFEKTFSFDVGSSEVHKVEVSLGRFSYFKGREVKVLVDGKPARRGGERGIGATPADSLRPPSRRRSPPLESTETKRR